MHRGRSRKIITLYLFKANLNLRICFEPQNIEQEIMNVGVRYSIIFTTIQDSLPGHSRRRRLERCDSTIYHSKFLVRYSIFK